MKETLLRYVVLGVSILAPPCLLYGILRSYPLDFYTIAGMTLMVPSYILLVTARIQLGRSFSISAQAKELVTHGLYSKIRHPVYVFAHLFLLGVVIALRNLSWLGYWAILLVVQILRVWKEEEVLEQRFGDAYTVYKKSTWF
jgi:protein-S-isoprenylcysteine O-methyltransferase Ste14